LAGETIETSQNNTIIRGDSLPTTIHSATFRVPRSRKPVLLAIQSEYPSQTLRIRSRISDQVWFNPLAYFYGTGLLFDLAFPRSYDYPSRYVDLESGKTHLIRKNQNPALLTRKERRNAWEDPNRRGQFHLIFGMSLVTTSRTYVARANGYDTNTGNFGLSFGGEYFYANSRSIAFEISHTSNFLTFLFPAWIFADRRLLSAHASIYDNIHLTRFSFGYGVNFTYNWSRTNFSEEIDCDRFQDKTIQQNSIGIGPVVNAYWKIRPDLKIGLIYRPTVVRFNAPTAQKYEHAITMDFKFNVNFSRKR
jgi:hypothetical protein